MAVRFPFSKFQDVNSYVLIAGVAAFLAALSAPPLPAKDPSLTAIELYSGPSGLAYVHITDVLINGKIELRSCPSSAKIDKPSYSRLPKVTLGAGASLEYGTDGILRLTRDAATSCVVPSNLKFEKNAPVTSAELASRAVLQAKVVSSGADANQPAPPLKPGVKIVFVNTPDVELAEFLRAERAETIPVWQGYLGKYPSAPHTGQAKQALSSLLVEDGTKSINAYMKSGPGPSRTYADLKNSKLRAAQALAVLPTSTSASKLDEDSKAQLREIIAEGQSEIQAYREALKSHARGYAHLTTAQQLTAALTEIDPHYAPAFAFETDTNNESSALDSKLQSADAFVAAKKFDDAFAAIAPYVSFADEVPRIAATLKAAYTSHYGTGRQLASTRDWEGAVKEFQTAIAIQPEEEAVAALKKARAELEVANNKHAADVALQQSQALAASGQVIRAYETLSALPAQQRSYVSAEMDRLAPSYVQAASDTAKELQQAHDPIHGLRDELEIERAYSYLRQASALSSDQRLKDRQQDLADKLSDYYLQRAKEFMQKPLGSGAGLGWSFLDKALLYRGSNLTAVRDERTRGEGAYLMRSRLSIRVVFRDQTSRRDSAGFAEQLADAMATGLENSGLPVRVVRPGESTELEPNFQLKGDVIEHSRSMVPTSQAKESKYRAGEQQVPNEEWNRTNREHESATLDLQRAQAALQGASAHGKKKEIAQASNQVVEAQKKVEALSAKLDSIPRTTSVDIIKPYTYTQKTFDMGVNVQLQFRIVDSSGNQVESVVPIGKEASRKFVVLENVKPEDTEGVKAEGTIPDEIKFFTDVENTVRDTLLKAVRESVAKFPDKIFEQARRRAENGDLDGAAESYILYLNSTPPEQSPKRGQAESFLREQFNIKRTLSAGS